MLSVCNGQPLRRITKILPHTHSPAAVPLVSAALFLTTCVHTWVPGGQEAGQPEGRCRQGSKPRTPAQSQHPRPQEEIVVGMQTGALEIRHPLPLPSPSGGPKCWTYHRRFRGRHCWDSSHHRQLWDRRQISAAPCWDAQGCSRRLLGSLVTAPSHAQESPQREPHTAAKSRGREGTSKGAPKVTAFCRKIHAQAGTPTESSVRGA